MTLRQKVYPYHNTSLKDMEGEKWEDLPGLDGEYCISNFGRIKRNDMEVVCINGRVLHLKARINVPAWVVFKNKSVGDTIYSLCISIQKQNIPYRFSIGRMLYYLFVKKFDLEDTSLVVINKDGNGKNVSLENLVLTDLRHKQQRIFKKNRRKDTQSRSYDEYLETGSDISVNPSCKQVSQYTLEGKLIQTFPSIKAAASVSGISIHLIIDVLKKRSMTSHGYVWAYGKKSSIRNVAVIKQAVLDNYRKQAGQKVTQYNLTGERVNTYISIMDAAAASGAAHSAISKVLQGKYLTAGGFIWRKGTGGASINVKNFVYGAKFTGRKKWKEVMQYTADGKYIKTYPSLRAAAEAMNCHSSSIGAVMSGKANTAKGFIWKFK